MCYAIDAAMTLVNMSIDRAEKTGDESYYANYIKIHKLLFLAQCFMLENYGKPLFHERITAHRCGPFVDGLELLIAMRDSDPITERFRSDEFVPLTSLRRGILEWIIYAFGTYSGEELVDATKSTRAYKLAVAGAPEQSRPEISTAAMKGSLQSLLLTWGPYYDQIMEGAKRA